MKTSIYCLAKSRDQANRIIHDLRRATIRDDVISVLYTDKGKKTRSESILEGGHKEEHAKSFGQKVSEFTSNIASKITGSEEEAIPADLTVEKGSKAAEGAVTGATTGGAIGGAIALLASMGAIAIPGFGTLIAAGPLLSALSGTAVGSITGGIAGSLVAAQIPEYYVKRASSALEEGQVLIAVAADSKDQVNKVCDILEKDGASDVSTINDA